jgi:hypothetical protein
MPEGGLGSRVVTGMPDFEVRRIMHPGVQNGVQIERKSRHPRNRENLVEHGQDPAAIAVAAIDLSNMLSYAGRAAEGVAILRRAQDRLPADPAREHLAVALLGVTYTSSSARMIIADLGEVDLSVPGLLQATTLARQACDEVFYLGSASAARDLAQRALAAGLPLDV